MESIKSYKSRDGRIFEDRRDCLTHETVLSIREILDEEARKAPFTTVTAANMTFRNFAKLRVIMNHHIKRTAQKNKLDNSGDVE